MVSMVAAPYQPTTQPMVRSTSHHLNSVPTAPTPLYCLAGQIANADSPPRPTPILTVIITATY
jgi:hypothetical protein